MGPGHACGVRVHKVQRVQKVQRERFLGLTGLTAGGFLSLTALRAEGCGIALTVHSEHILHYANWICKGASAT